MVTPAPAPAYAALSLVELEELYTTLERARDAAAELVEAGRDPVPWALLRATLDRPLGITYREIMARHAAVCAGIRHELHAGPVDRDECPDCELERLELTAAAVR